MEEVKFTTKMIYLSKTIISLKIRELKARVDLISMELNEPRAKRNIDRKSFLEKERAKLIKELNMTGMLKPMEFAKFFITQTRESAKSSIKKNNRNIYLLEMSDEEFQSRQDLSDEAVEYRKGFTADALSKDEYFINTAIRKKIEKDVWKVIVGKYGEQRAENTNSN